MSDLRRVLIEAGAQALNGGFTPPDDKQRQWSERVLDAMLDKLEEHDQLWLDLEQQMAAEQLQLSPLKTKPLGQPYLIQQLLSVLREKPEGNPDLTALEAGSWGNDAI